MSLENVIETNSLELVASLDSGEMYSWSTTEVYFQRSSGRFFVLSDSGCSCNYFGEEVHNLSDFEEVTRERAMDAIRDEGNGGWLAASADNVQREIANVRDFR